MNFIKYSKKFLTFSAIIWLISIFFIFYEPLNLGIDFTGGTKLELQKPKDISNEDLLSEIKKWYISKNKNQEIKSISYQNSENNSIVLKMKELNNDEKNELIEYLKSKFNDIKELSYLNIGPSVSENLKNNAYKAILLAIIGMILFIAFSFRNVPKHISPWKFSFVAIVTLIHDVFIMIGLFVILNKFVFQTEIDMFFITAVLTILGYSVNDTIVIFDRFRENLLKMKKGDSLEQIGENSILSTLARSINTSLTVLIVLITFLLIGPASIKMFILALTIGVVFGTYSSVCVALPLLISLLKNKI